MSAKLIFEAMNEVSDRYYEEAENYQAPKRRWVKWGGVAACLAVVALAAIAVIPSYFHQQSIESPEHPDSIVVDDPTPATPGVYISLSDIRFNELEEMVSAALKAYDPALYDQLEWGKSEITAFYGDILKPTYRPVNVEPTYHSYIIADKSGNLESDTAWSYYYESNQNTDNGCRRGFFITASKSGVLNDCIYLLPENEVVTSDVGGVAVTFGYRSVSYGPYDPATHEPSGYYDMYVAEFECGGISCQVVAEQMEAEEVVKVVASIICGEEVEVEQ